MASQLIGMLESLDGYKKPSQPEEPGSHPAALITPQMRRARAESLEIQEALASSGKSGRRGRRL